MAQVLVRNLDDSVVEQLKANAARHHRSLEAEVRSILEETARRQRLRQEIAAELAQFRARQQPNQTDSADLIREDRER